MKIGLALGSGGARGLAHIEFLKLFDELGIRPCVISGTSMGAAIAGLYASGLSGKEIEEHYRKIDLREMAKLLDIGWNNKRGFIKGEKVMKWYEDRLKCKNFEETKIPLKIVATDYWSREQAVFEKGSITDAVRASVSIPGLFEPKKIKGKVYVDGGIFNPVPYDIIRDDCDKVVAIDLVSKYLKEKDVSEVPTVVDIMWTTAQIMQAAIERQKLSKGKPDIQIRVSLPGIRTMDFHKVGKILERARDDVEELRKKLA